MNRDIGIDRTIVMTINQINKELRKMFGSNHSKEIENLAFFVPWDLERNIPKVTVDVKGISLNAIWVA
jgi:hypothetical protein